MEGNEIRYKLAQHIQKHHLKSQDPTTILINSILLKELENKYKTANCNALRNLRNLNPFDVLYFLKGIVEVLFINREGKKGSHSRSYMMQ